MGSTVTDEIVTVVRAHAGTDDLAQLYGEDDHGTRRRRNLERYLHWIDTNQPTTALIGEAPGHRGSVRTGVPFVDEWQAQDPASDFLRLCDFQVDLANTAGDSSREATSKVMWATLAALDLRPLLWAACSRHPHESGVPSSNRTPKPREIREHHAELRAVLAWANVTHVVAVGNVASRALDAIGCAHTRVRHPARGGAAAFRLGMTNFVQSHQGEG